MKRKYLILNSMASFLISAISSAMITSIVRESTPKLSNLLAAIFWLSMIAGFVFCGKLAKITRSKKRAVPRPLLFFRTKPLKVIDAVLIVSIISTSLCVVFHSSMTILWGLLLFLDISAFEFHILFSIINKEEYSN